MAAAAAVVKKRVKSAAAAIVMKRVKLGSEGLEVSAQGFGCREWGRGEALPKFRSETYTIKLIHHAINSGVTFIDTSRVFVPLTYEFVIGKALKGGFREKVQLASKLDIRSDVCYMAGCGIPAYVRSYCEASLKRLEIDCIDLCYANHNDSEVPIEVIMGELKKLVEEGKIKYVGLSEASASTIRRAHAVHPLTAVQTKWSMWSRDLEAEVVPTCRRGFFRAS